MPDKEKPVPTLEDRARDLLALDAKATPGPWVRGYLDGASNPDADPEGFVASVPDEAGDVVKSVADFGFDGVRPSDDARFVCTARNTAPDLARAYLAAAADLRQFERSAGAAFDALKLLDEARHIDALNLGPLADAVDEARDNIRTLIEGRTRPEWTFDRVLRERDEARAALAALTEEHARLTARHAALSAEVGR